MKTWKLWVASLSFLAILLTPTLAAADVNDFTVTSFVAKESLTRQDPQGELHVVERITVDFTDNNHGILRAIPQRYKGHALQLQVNSIGSDTQAPVDHSTYTSNGNTVLKIGNPNQTVTGTQEYTLDYTLRNVISFYKDHDELYWDVNGTDWTQPFTNVSVELQLPADLHQTKQPRCYTGNFGSTSQQCVVFQKGTTVAASTIQSLQPNQTLTVVAAFPTGYFHPSTWRETMQESMKQIIGLVLPTLILGGGTFLYWLLRGRDPRGTGVIIPQYGPPDNLKPLAVGTLLHFKADNRDITATIVDLAVRKYIKIIETTTKHRLRKDTKSYSLQLLRTDLEALDPYEHSIIDAIFDRELSVGRQIDLSKMRNDFSATAQTIRRRSVNELTKLGYFRSNPSQAGTWLYLPLGILAMLIFYLGMVMGLWLSVGVGIGVVIGFLFVRQMAARTAKGVAAKEHILGLKLFLEVTEKDRLKALQSPTTAAVGAEPARTVELFETLLPYAMVLGVEEQWAKQFADLYTTPPDWYAGNWSTFNMYYFATELNSGIGSAVNTAFSAPSSSGSSGFSGGGGFAGGGGGGGGGGGW